MTLLSLWLGLSFNRARHEERAAKAILEADGKVTYNWQIRRTNVDASEKLYPPGPVWLREFLGPHWFDSIVRVEFREQNWRDPQARANKRFGKIAPALAKLTELRSLQLSQVALTASDYRLIGSLNSLEELSCWSMRVSDEGAAALSNAQRLSKLRFKGVHISALGLQELVQLPSLIELSFTSPYEYDARGDDTQEHWLLDEGLQAIANCKRLQYLYLFNTLITDEGMRSLQGCQQLKKLTLSSPLLTSTSLRFAVESFKDLEYLGTWQWKITDEDLAQLQQLPKLRGLGLLTRDRITDAGLPHLAKLDGLTWLLLYGDKISEPGLAHLHGMQNLEHLDLTSTTVAKHSPAAKELQKALAQCRVRLPKTKKEREMEAAFHAAKWGQVDSVVGVKAK